jgi:signal transduction histidine kinase
MEFPGSTKLARVRLGMVASALAVAVALLLRRDRRREGLRQGRSADAQAEAAAASQMRDHLIASTSHDLKTPLASIRLLTHLMKREAAQGSMNPERLQQRAELIEANVVKMSSLISELLDVARLQGGKPIQLQLADSDLVALSRKMADNFELASGTQHIVVDAAVSELVGCWDASRLERVLTNLVANSIKYSPTDSDVTIRLSRPQRAGRDEALVEIIDQGRGIPAEDMPRIFDWFHRGGNAADVAGTGVGLASAKLIVEKHGGTIAVHSRVGHGTTVALRLPLPVPEGRREDVRVEEFTPEAAERPAVDRE